MAEEVNPHALIIARHQARKAEREKAEKEQEGEEKKPENQEEGKPSLERKLSQVDKFQRDRELMLQRRESMNQPSKLAPLSLPLPLETTLPAMGGEVYRYEGQLKGWKFRYLYLEDRLPLTLKVFKHFRAEEELLDSYELTADCNLEEDSIFSSTSFSSSSGSGSAPASPRAPRASISESPESSPGFLRKTLKPQKSREHSFNIKLETGKTVRLAAETYESKLQWCERITQLLDKHHGLARTLVPDTLPTPTAPTVSSLLSGDPKKTDHVRKSSRGSSINEEALINPMCDDEVLGKSFRNELFGIGE